MTTIDEADRVEFRRALTRWLDNDVRPHVLHVKSDKRFSVRVLTDAKRYSWHLGERGNVARTRHLVLRAGQPGTYRLVVAANGHVSRAVVVVSP